MAHTIALGRLALLEWEEPRTRIIRSVSFPLRSAPFLSYDARGRLHIAHCPELLGGASAEQIAAYAHTHWGERGRGENFEALETRAGQVLGKGTKIVYTTRKRGDDALTDYEHTWGEGGRGRVVAPTVMREDVCHGRRKLALFRLRGGNYRVTSRGIVG